MKFILLLLLLSLIPSFQLFAQQTGIDSYIIKATLLKKDIRHFYLNKQDWKACRKQHFNPNSDYFKPKESNIENSNFLIDSVYVKAYRNAAYKKTKHKRTILKVELIGGIVGGIIFTGLVVIIAPFVSRLIYQTYTDKRSIVIFKLFFMKRIILLLLLSLVINLQLFAQETQPDSAALKTKMAKADARYFRLNKQAKAAHRKNHLLRTSDYFKPTETTVKDPKWINDSIYVTAYKTAAYQELSKQRTTGHNVLIAGGIVVGALVIAEVIFLAIIFN